MDHTLYDMSESPVDIGGVSLWGPGQALSAASYKTSVSATTPSTPNTPPYSQTLDLERRMLDISSVALIPPACLHTTVIAGSRQPVCTAPVPVALAPSAKSRARGKNFADPCDIAPLKKRRIQVEMLSPDERDKVLHKREKNKVAAEKCRVKRREKVQQTRAEYEDYLDANESLEAEIRKLTEEKVMLQELLDNHNCILKIKVEV